MRITPVTNSTKRNLHEGVSDERAVRFRVSERVRPQKQVSFGRFADDNAGVVVKRAFGDNEWTKPRDDYYYKLMDEADYLTIYTDRDGIAKGRFDDKFIHSNEGKKVDDCIELMTDTNTLENLGIRKNVCGLGMTLRLIKEVLEGVDFLAQLRSDDDGAEAQAEQEAKRQARIDHLIW